jgi:hypothetical protein
MAPKFVNAALALALQAPADAVTYLLIYTSAASEHLMQHCITVPASSQTKGGSG